MTILRRALSFRSMMLAGVSIPSFLIILLSGVVVFISFRSDGKPFGALTLENYINLYTDELAWRAFVNTGRFTLVTLFVAAFFAIPIAWLVERTDFGHRRLVYSLMVVRVIMPGFLTAMGWIFLFHPRIGAVNQFAMSSLGFSEPVFSITTIAGMGIVQGLGITSVMFIMTSSSFRNIDVSLEEAARMSGATTLTTLRRVTLPLAWPSILGALLYTAAIAISVFDIPLIIGFAERIFVFSTYLYLRVNPVEDVPQYGISGAASSLMVVLGIAASVWYTRTIKRSRRYEVIRGKGYQPKAVRLGRLRPVATLFVSGYFLLSAVLPLLLLLFVATQPFVRPPTLENISQANLDTFRNLPVNAVSNGIRSSALLVLVVPTMAMLVSALFAWTVLRSRARFRFFFDYIAFLPQAVPNVVFALGALIVALNWRVGAFDLYRTLALIMLVLILLHVSFGSRVINAALVQIHPELEEAAQTSGASPSQVSRRILFPILRPTFVFGWLWLAMLTFRELTIPTFLASPGNAPLPVLIWYQWTGGRTAGAAALTASMFFVMVPLAMVYLYLAKVED